MKKFYFKKYYFTNCENTIPISFNYIVYCEEKKTDYYYEIENVDSFHDLLCCASTSRYDMIYTDKTFPFFKDCVRTHFYITITEKNFKKGQIVAKYREHKDITMEEIVKVLPVEEFKEFMNDLKKGEN